MEEPNTKNEFLGKKRENEEINLDKLSNNDIEEKNPKKEKLIIPNLDDFYNIKQLKQKIVREKLLKQKLYDMQRMERLKIDYDEYLKYQNNIREREKRFENNVEKTQRERTSSK